MRLLNVAVRAAMCAPAVLILFLLAGCSAESAAPPAASAPSPASSDPAPVRTVRVAHPEVQAAADSFPSSLYIERDVKVAARRTGVIEKVLVDRGDPIRAGDPMALLESDIAAGELELAVQEVRLAQAEFERVRSLFAQKVVSPQESLRAEVALEQAKTSEALARAALERCNVRAPFDGVIAERWAMPGMRVVEDDGTPLFRVVAREPLRARVDVPEERLASLATGSKAVVEAAAGSESHPATVVFVSPAVDAGSGTAPVIVQLAGAANGLRVGSAVRVRLDGAGDSRPSLLSIPREALPAGVGGQGSTATVLVISGGRVAARKVRVVGERGGSVVVSGPLGVKDDVIVGAGPGLAEGDAVQAAGGSR